MAEAERQYTAADLYGADGRPRASDIDQDRLFNCYFLAPMGAQAIDRPVEQSLQKLDALNQQQAQSLSQQPSPPTQDDPGRGPRM